MHSALCYRLNRERVISGLITIDNASNIMTLCCTGKGDLFGSDLAHVGDEQDTVVKSSSDVRSLTYCDLQCISLSGLKQTLRMYPELAEQCTTDLLHDLTYNLRDGFTDQTTTVWSVYQPSR